MKEIARKGSQKNYLVDPRKASEITLRTGESIKVFPDTFLHRVIFDPPIKPKGGKQNARESDQRS